MSDNTTLNPGAAGDTIRDKDRAGVKTQIVALDLAPGGAETLMNGVMPVNDNSGSLTVDAPVGTPVFVRLSDGSSAIATLPVSQAAVLGTSADGAAGLPSVQYVIAGYDGTNVQAIATDASGILQVDIVGDSATQAGAAARTADFDSGAGTVTTVFNGIALPASGGPVAGGTSANPIRTDPTGSTTQPVSGTVTATGPLTDTQLRATPVPVSGTVNLGTAAVTNAGTFAVQIAANSSVNQAQVAGTATDVNSGNKSAGTQRVVLATDQPALTNALKVDGSAVTQPVSGTVSITANSAVNVAQITGTATSVNSGTKDAGTQRVILASDQTVVPVSDNAGSLTVDAPVGTPVFVTATPGTTGGWSKIKYAAQTTTKQAVKASAGTFGGYYAYNPNATVAYIQVFDVASAGVTLGTTVPDMIFGIPATSAANLEITNGVNFGTAVTLACTTTATGSTAPSTGLDLTVFFK